MGLFDAVKKQLLKVIEWSDESSDTIVYRYPLTDRKEIMKGSQLTVRESQVAVFVAQGKIADVFAPGRYKLDTENLPILTTIFSWKYAFESPYTGEIYFVNTKQFINQKWGTSNPIPIRDKDFGMARVRAFGVFAFRVKDAAKFLREISGTGSSYKTEDIVEQLKKIIQTNLVDAIAESKMAVLDLAANYREFGALTKRQALEEFEALGVDITSLFIESVSFPDEVAKALDQRTSVGMFGDSMPQYIQYQTGQAIPEAAKNPSGGMGVLGAGFGVGMAMMNTMGNSMGKLGDAPPKKAADDSVKCYKCGAQVPLNAKFCSGCGATVNAKSKCRLCGFENSPSAKFCSGCGKPLAPASVCKKCGAELEAGQRFCQECGIEVI